jgi:hypothetical protein
MDLARRLRASKPDKNGVKRRVAVACSDVACQRKLTQAMMRGFAGS